MNKEKVKTAKMKLPLHEFSFVKATAPHRKIHTLRRCAETYEEFTVRTYFHDSMVVKQKESIYDRDRGGKLWKN